MSKESKATKPAQVNPDLPTVGELVQEFSLPDALEAENQQAFEKNFDQKSINIQREYITLTALGDHYKLKKEWSGFIKGTLKYLIGFQSTLLVFVGFGWLDYKDYSWLIPTLLLQTLAHVVALAVIVVTSLFDNHKSGV